MTQSIRTDDSDRDLAPMMTELDESELQAIAGGGACGYAIVMALLSPGDPAAAAGVSICFV